MTDADLASPPTQLDPAALVARARALVESGTTDLADGLLEVPLWYYRDVDLFERERTEVLATTPLALVPTCRLPAPHDFLVRDVLGTSVLLTRDGDGRAHAFLNYCRHRGAKPAEGCGSSRRFTCPYHAWTYDSGGQLVGLPGQEAFTELDRSTHGLVELPSEERNGFVWVVLTAGADDRRGRAPRPPRRRAGPVAPGHERAPGRPHVHQLGQLEVGARGVRRELPLRLRPREQPHRAEHRREHHGRSTPSGCTTASRFPLTLDRRCAPTTPSRPSTTCRSSTRCSPTWCWPSAWSAPRSSRSSPATIRAPARCSTAGWRPGPGARRGHPGRLLRALRGRARRGPQRGLRHAAQLRRGHPPRPSTTTWSSAATRSACRTSCGPSPPPSTSTSPPRRLRRPRPPTRSCA